MLPPLLLDADRELLLGVLAVMELGVLAVLVDRGGLTGVLRFEMDAGPSRLSSLSSPSSTSPKSRAAAVITIRAMEPVPKVLSALTRPTTRGSFRCPTNLCGKSSNQFSAPLRTRDACERL